MFKLLTGLFGKKSCGTKAPAKNKARMEHRLEELLAATVNHNGSRGQLKGNTVLPQEKTAPPGVSKMQSSRAQQLAR